MKRFSAGLCGLLLTSAISVGFAAETRYGEIIKAGEGAVTIRHRGNSLLTYEVAPNAKITRNGKKVALAELRSIDFAKITAEEKNRVQVATSIDARSDAR